jgi:5-formyltetrahydrofolate cyclo-ligase
VSKRRRKARSPKRATPKRKSSKSRSPTRSKSARPTKRAIKKTASSKVKNKAVAPKAELRQRLRAKRAQLSAEEQRLAADRLLANLAATRLFRVSRRIACYLPSDGEIDPSLIVQRIWRMRKQAFLPVLSHLSHDRLWFAPARAGMELQPNRFGIPEPRVSASELVRAEDLDLILLPLVAFDATGNRLGRGAGFYDRSLAFLRFRRYLRRPHLFGLGHDFQRVPRITADPWDVPLDGVVTDRTVYYTNL